VPVPFIIGILLSKIFLSLKYDKNLKLMRQIKIVILVEHPLNNKSFSYQQGYKKTLP